MNIEEKEAIDILQNCIADYVIGDYCEKCGDRLICEDRNEDCYFQQAIDIAVNLIEKQSKEIEELKDKNKSIVYNYEMVVDKLENSTPNDKIKANIEKLQEDIKYSANPLSIDNSKFGIKVLHSLLEKE